MNFYNVAKILNPLHPRKAKRGVNVQELVKPTFPKEYNNWVLNAPHFDWINDLDGVLDYLCGIRALFKIDTGKVIKLIEDNSK